MNATHRQSTTKQTKQRLRRGPGRPSTQALSGAQLRDVIVAASAVVYANWGYQQVTVERILKEARVSRPTFYRYFSDRYEVLDVAIGAVNDQLRDLVVAAVLEAKNIEQLLAGVVDAYFVWGERIGPLAGPIYRELHDQASPASAHRLRVLDELMAVFTEQPVEGLPITDEPLLYYAAMHVVEQLGHASFWPELLPKAERKRRRDILLQALRGILLTPGKKT